VPAVSPRRGREATAGCRATIAAFFQVSGVKQNKLAPHTTHGADGNTVLAHGGSAQLTLEGVTRALQASRFNFNK
jgi:hypothetical protein